MNENVAQACRLAKTYNKILIGGYRRLSESPKDRAIIISRTGEIVLDRVKYNDTAFVTVENFKIGHILCDELVRQGMRSADTSGMDLIVHPIGVGMFSDEQFEEWIHAAREIAITYQTKVIGTSHADGSFRGGSVSIPIAYGIDEHGDSLFISKNDVRTRILELEKQEEFNTK
ncbi:hypothetical protein N0M98_21585 [Paenibacillus doosanensis]|uniref:hypothetical protein n=1 Tax=Paenibacillus doosanensis TaxID=1229154 RepID=UPI00217FE0DA|nr:hypothetical protein [Paenibacillus doosanensis]MCS7462719.1 hypothetical protein [Paenibacillus doosanensis]